jgi:DNA-directed RNA polymerase subunit RPC12/RpoP
MTALYACTRCQKNVSFKDVRYKNNGKDLICVSCHDAVVKKQTVSEKPHEVQTTVTGKIVKEKYICTKCRYNFTYKPSHAALMCPYCSCKEVLKDDYNAEKLLKEAIEMD